MCIKPTREEVEIDFSWRRLDHYVSLSMLENRNGTDAP